MAKDKLKIGLDFDGVLAYYDDEHKSVDDQEVIPKMLRKVENWIENGHFVYLWTAKAKSDKMMTKLRSWLDKNGLKAITLITNEKLPGTDYYIDDAALKVECNSGEFMYGDPITNDIETMLERPRMIRNYRK